MESAVLKKPIASVSEKLHSAPRVPLSLCAHSYPATGIIAETVRALAVSHAEFFYKLFLLVLFRADN